MTEIIDKLEIVYEKLNLRDAMNNCKKAVSAPRMHSKCFPKEREILTPDMLAKMLAGNN